MEEISRSIFQRLLTWPFMVLRYTNARFRPLNRLNAGSFIRLLGRIDLRVVPGGNFSRGSATAIDKGGFIEIRGILLLSNNVYVGRNSHIVCFDRISIGSNVRIGENVSIHDENHIFEPLPLSLEDRKKYTVSPVEIGDRVWVGAGVIVLPGSIIGHDTVVAAGSVVRGKLEPESLYAGVPAKFVRKLTLQQSS